MADRWRGGRPPYRDERDEFQGRGHWRGGGRAGYGPGARGPFGEPDMFGGRFDRGGYGPAGYGGGYADPYWGEVYPEHWGASYGAGWGPYGAFGQRARPFGGHGPDQWGRRYRGYGQDDDERGWWDRTSDEVSSWFGDEEAEHRRREDERTHHRGRGPRGYTRSDERIREDVHDRLTDDPYLDASDIEVQVSGGEVTLNGTVDSRFAKRRAEDTVEDVLGVAHCQNNLRVGPADERRAAAATPITGRTRRTGNRA